MNPPNFKTRDRSQLRVLIIDNSPSTAEGLSEMIGDQFPGQVQIVRAESGAAALALAEREPIDVALVDEGLQDMDGLEVVSAMVQRQPQAAAILLAGKESEYHAQRAAERGASDYVAKFSLTPTLLKQTMTQAVRSARLSAQNRQLMQQLNRTNQELDHFMRSLSHDMSANFMVLETSFNELKHRCDERHEVNLVEGVTHVEACLRESKRFVDDLATLAKTGSLEMTPERVDVGQVVKDVLYELEMVLAERNVQVTVAPQLPAVWCHENRLRQVITNLVRNALKHGCDKSNPRITIERLPSTDGDGFVWLRVHDNGRGIPAESRDAIFLPGHRLATAHPDGSGMGLAIVRRIIEHYGGTIRLDGDVPQGAAFAFSLPGAV